MLPSLSTVVNHQLWLGLQGGKQFGASFQILVSKLGRINLLFNNLQHVENQPQYLQTIKT